MIALIFAPMMAALVFSTGSAIWLLNQWQKWQYECRSAVLSEGISSLHQKISENSGNIQVSSSSQKIELNWRVPVKKIVEGSEIQLEGKCAAVLIAKKKILSAGKF